MRPVCGTSHRRRRGVADRRRFVTEQPKGEPCPPRRPHRARPRPCRPCRGRRSAARGPERRGLRRVPCRPGPRRRRPHRPTLGRGPRRRSPCPGRRARAWARSRRSPGWPARSWCWPRSPASRRCSRPISSSAGRPLSSAAGFGGVLVGAARAARAPGGRRVARAGRRPQVRPRLRGGRRGAGRGGAAHRDLPGAQLDRPRRPSRCSPGSGCSPAAWRWVPAGCWAWWPCALTVLAGCCAAVAWGRTVMDDDGPLDPVRSGLAGAAVLLGVGDRAVPGAPGRRRPRPAGHRRRRPDCETVVTREGPQALLERPGLALLGGLLLAGAVVLCSVIAPSLRPRLAAVGGAAGHHRRRSSPRRWAGCATPCRPTTSTGRCRAPAWSSPGWATPR